MRTTREADVQAPVLLMPRGTLSQGDEVVVSFPMSLEQMLISRFGIACLDTISWRGYKDIARKIITIDAMHLELPKPGPEPDSKPEPGLSLLDRRSLLTYLLWQASDARQGDTSGKIAKLLREPNPEDIEEQCRRVSESPKLVSIYEGIEQFAAFLARVFITTKEIELWRLDVEEVVRLKGQGLGDEAIIAQKEEIKRKLYNRIRLRDHRKNHVLTNGSVSGVRGQKRFLA
jgi:hypothetical protein